MFLSWLGVCVWELFPAPRGWLERKRYGGGGDPRHTSLGLIEVEYFQRRGRGGRRVEGKNRRDIDQFRGEGEGVVCWSGVGSGNLMLVNRMKRNAEVGGSWVGYMRMIARFGI